MDGKIKENIIIYDWLSFTTKIHALDSLIDILGFNGVDFHDIYGYYGYQNRITHNGVSILYNGSEDMGILVEMSGQGCRTFETEGNGDYEALFGIIRENPGEINITRLDIAYDDHEGIFNMNTLFKDTRSHNYISKSRKCTINECISGKDGNTIYHGSKSSDTLIRIYDKAKERGYEDGTHWIRFEIQLRAGNAFGFINNSLPMGEKFLGVAYNYLRYVKPDKSDDNKWRWEITGYWNKFIGSAKKIRIYQKPGIEYNEESLERFVVTNSGNSINVYRQIYGDENFLKAMEIQKKSKKYSAKQQVLADKYAGMSHQTPRIVVQAEKAMQRHGEILKSASDFNNRFNA